MSSLNEQVVIDFDLDSSQQTSNYPDKSEAINEEVTASLFQAKLESLALDVVQRIIYKSKSQLARAQKTLHVNKEKCKQAIAEEKMISERITLLCEKNYSNDKKSLQEKQALCHKEKSNYIKQVCLEKGTVLNTSKLCKKFKAVLEKYINDSDESDEKTNTNYNSFHPPMSQAKKRKISNLQKSTVRKTGTYDKSHVREHSDFIKVSSLDTGKIDKADHIKGNTVDGATSPILNSVHVGTSPRLAFVLHSATSPMSVHEMSTSPEPISEIGSPSSTIDSTMNSFETKEISTSPVVPQNLAAIPALVKVCETPETNFLNDKSKSGNVDEKLCVHKQAINEKDCLELKNSDNYDKKDISECELKMNLNQIRIELALISPISDISQNEASSGCAPRIACGCFTDGKMSCKEALQVCATLESRISAMEAKVKMFIKNQNKENGHKTE